MAGAKILLVEDSRAQAAITKESLEKAGYEVCWVEKTASVGSSAAHKKGEVTMLLDKISFSLDRCPLYGSRCKGDRKATPFASLRRCQIRDETSLPSE